jgi:hypothetical protein
LLDINVLLCCVWPAYQDRGENWIDRPSPLLVVRQGLVCRTAWTRRKATCYFQECRLTDTSIMVKKKKVFKARQCQQLFGSARLPRQQPPDRRLRRMAVQAGSVRNFTIRSGNVPGLQAG